jgi:hypothetical protein
MTFNRVVGCVVLAFAASIAAAGEPTALSGVKTLVIRDSAPSPESAICIAALDARLSEAGFTVQEASDGAEAELSTAFRFAAEGRGLMGLTSSDEVEVSFSILIKSLPGHHLLFSFLDHTKNSLTSACDKMAKKTVKEIQSARVEASAKETK